MEQKPLLTHEETLALIELAQNGDSHAQEVLIERNYALVKSIVRGYLNRGIEYEDLLQIGSMGLMKAIRGYNPAFDVRFSTYAVPMIAGELKRFLRDDGMIKVSRSLKETAIKVFRAQDLLKRELGREPTIEELSTRVGIDACEIVEALDAVRDPVSLYAPAFEDEDSHTQVIDLMAKDDSKELIDRLLLKELIGQLSPREKKLIILRFFQDKTQSEIAKTLGVSQVQVSRLITKTIEKLKKAAQG